jgi:hypothetical protein
LTHPTLPDNRQNRLGYRVSFPTEFDLPKSGASKQFVPDAKNITAAICLMHVNSAHPFDPAVMEQPYEK